MKVEDVDEECDQILEDFQKSKFLNKISSINLNEMLTESDVISEPEDNEAIVALLSGNEDDPYDLSLGEIITELNLRIATDDIPRMSCACHKANLAVRKIILACVSLSKCLSILTLQAATMRSSNNQSRIFEQKKSRLRCENDTRWSSSFLMLQSFQNAFHTSMHGQWLKIS